MSETNGHRPIEPVRFRLMDGEEREFLLSAGSIKRLKKRFKAEKFDDITDKYDVFDVGIAFLYEGRLIKDEMTEEEFAELVPPYPEALTITVAKLLGASLPEPRPTTEAAPPQSSQSIQ